MKMIFLRQVLKMVQYITLGIFLQVLLMGLLHASPGKAQKSIENIYVHLKEGDQSLEEIFNNLEEQTGFMFSYRRSDVSTDSFVSNYSRSSLAEVLRDIAKNNMLYFKRVNNNISVKKLDKPQSLRVEEEFDQPIKQQMRVTGTVLSDRESEPLPGVSVLIKGTVNGTTTDLDGKYAIEVNPGAVLQFSYIGYQTFEVEVGNQSKIDVSLVDDTRQLEEVVVVGYGTQKKSDLTGSLASVSGDQLKSMMTTSLDQALQGRVAGVQVTTNSGQPGGGISVRIRGANSINGSNEPLYVVDGIPISGDAGGTAVGFDWAGGGNGQTAVSALATINPADIVSVEVLKDASATAIYGSRAANGVVLITTKRGKFGESKFNYDAYYGVQQPSKYLEVMNLQEYAEYQNERAIERGVDPRIEFMDPSLLGDGTNWQKEIFRKAAIQSHQLSVLGGSEKTQYAISGGYFKQEGTVIGSGFERFSLRMNVDNQTKDWFKIGNSMMFSRTDERITLNDDEGGVVSTAITQAPDIPVYNIDGSYAGPTIDGSNTGITNPVAMALERDLTLKRNRLLTNLYGEVTFFQGLKFRSEIGADVQFSDNYGFNPTYQWGTVVNNRANSRRRKNQSLFYILKNYLTFNRTLFTRHNLTLMAGHEIQESSWENMMAGRQDFVSNDIQELNAGDPTTAVNSQGKGSATLQSVFGRLNYDYDDRYLLTFTMRADGSSKFGPSNKWGYFPSAAVAWKVNNEDFFNVPAINQFKLRLGWGMVGNEGIPGYAYGAAMVSRGTPLGTGFVPANIPNPEVQWESSEQYNLGLDLELFTSRLNLTVDVYQKNVDNLLITLPMPSYMGGGSWMGISEPWVNAGKIENKGVEIMLNTVNVTKGDFEWSTDIVFSKNINDVKYIGGETGVIFETVQWFNTVTRTTEGYPMGMFYGFRTDGIFNNLEEISAHAEQNSRIDRTSGVYPGDIRFKDLNNDGVVDDNDRENIGNPNPDFTFGFNNHFSYKGIDLTITTNGSYGNDIYNFGRRNAEGMRNLFANQLETVNDRARLGMYDESVGLNDPANVYVVNAGTEVPRAINTDPNNNTRVSDRYVEDGSYLRIQNIILGYTFPEKLIHKLGLQKLKVYTNVQNLYTFTNYTGFDPEIGAFNQNPLLQGVDNGRYPLPRVYTFGINVDF